MTTREILYTVLNIVSAIVGLVIGSRIVFALIGANPSTPIVAWINNASSALIYPFSGLFQDFVLANGSFIDLTAIIALIVYAILFSIVHRIIGLSTRGEYSEEIHHSHSHI